MRKLVFASHNPHKVKEIRAILGPEWMLLSLDDIGCHEEIPEPFDSLEENALAKARHVWKNYRLDCFADDTGLEVDALGGLPGVHSARYAGVQKSSTDNLLKLLRELTNVSMRQARFRTVIALVSKGQEHIFEGRVEGRIGREPSGKGGFGYDPVFIPDGFQQTFSEMSDEQKNAISHRFRALEKLRDFLNEPGPHRSEY